MWSRVDLDEFSSLNPFELAPWNGWMNGVECRFLQPVSKLASGDYETLAQIWLPNPIKVPATSLLEKNRVHVSQ